MSLDTCKIPSSVYRFVILSLTLMSLFKANAGDKKKLFPEYSVTKYGTVLGIQRGNFFNVELGVERRHKQIKLKNPNSWALNGVLEYAWESNTMGLKLGSWFKTGRTGLTYGANLLGVSDFENFRPGIAPSIGFSIRGIHAQASYNAILLNKELIPYNTLHLSIKLFISRSSQIHKKETARAKERAKRKKQRAKED